MFWKEGKVNYTPNYLFFFLLINARSCLPVVIRRSVSILKFYRNVCIIFSAMNSCLCIYYFAVWSNFNLLHNSQWIIFSTQACLVLYSLYTSLRHLHIMCLMVWSHSPHKLHLLLLLVVVLIFACILHPSSGPFWVLSVILTTVQSGWSGFFHWCSVSLVSFSELWGPFLVYQLLLVLLSVSYPRTFFFLDFFLNIQVSVYL